jgi:cell fate (sporulation/competence/biofilm development) regulator YlbF (YheA/YmcA/DUF963 family)
MDAILALAKQLGSAIAADERCNALKQAAVAFKADADAQKLEQEYTTAANELRAKEQQGQPIEPEEKRREAELRTQMATNETIRRFVRAQADFRQLMQAVNETIEKELDLQ